MKKLFILTFLFCIPHMYCLQFIKDDQGWHWHTQELQEEKKVFCFLQNFGAHLLSHSNTILLQHENYVTVGDKTELSVSFRKKIIEKSEVIDKVLGHQLFSGTLILAAVPQEIQQKIIAEIDPIFSDKQLRQDFFARSSLKEQLRWFACVNKKMTDNECISFKESKFFGPNIPKQFNKKELLSLSSDKMIFLAGKLDLRSDDNSEVWLYWKKAEKSRCVFNFNRSQLIALNNLIDKKYLRFAEDKKVECRIVRKRGFKEMLFQIGTRIIIPLLIHYGVRPYLLNAQIREVEPSINDNIRAANDALDRFEKISGEGPFIRHQLRSADIFFDWQLCLHFIPVLNFWTLSKKKGIAFVSYSLTSLVLMLLSCVWVGTGESIVHFDIFDLIQWVFSLAYYPITNNKVKNIKIPIKEIPAYLNNPQITIL